MIDKILSSNVTNYLSVEELKRLQTAFISLHPGENSHNIYVELPESMDGRRNIVAQLCFYWTTLREKVKDIDGNLWTYYRFTTMGSIRENFQLLDHHFTKRLSCLQTLNELLQDIASLKIPLEVGEITHNNLQRLELEKQEKRTAIHRRLTEFFNASGKKFRMFLRTGGNPKKIPKNILENIINGLDDNKIEFKINENSTQWYPKWKSYILHFPSGSDYAYLYKI